jgi:hypothetical protein
VATNGGTQQPGSLTQLTHCTGQDRPFLHVGSDMQGMRGPATSRCFWTSSGPVAGLHLPWSMPHRCVRSLCGLTTPWSSAASPPSSSHRWHSRYGGGQHKTHADWALYQTATARHTLSYQSSMPSLKDEVCSGACLQAYPTELAGRKAKAGGSLTEVH